MTKRDNQESNKRQSPLEDLELTTEQASETKDGTSIQGGRGIVVISGGSGNDSIRIT